MSAGVWWTAEQKQIMRAVRDKLPVPDAERALSGPGGLERAAQALGMPECDHAGLADACAALVLHSEHMCGGRVMCFYCRHD